MACYESKNITDEYKYEVAKLMQDEYLEALEAAKTEWMYFSGKFGNPKTISAERIRERRHRGNALARKTMYIDMVLDEIIKEMAKGAMSCNIKNMISKETVNEASPYCFEMALNMICESFLVAAPCPAFVKITVKSAMALVSSDVLNVLNGESNEIKEFLGLVIADCRYR